MIAEKEAGKHNFMNLLLVRSVYKEDGISANETIKKNFNK